MSEAKNQKPDVLFVVPAIAHEGISKQVLLQIDALLNRGYSVKLVVLTTAQESVLAAFAPGLAFDDVVQLHQPDSYLSVRALKLSVTVALQIKGILTDWKPEIVFAHAPYAHFIMRLALLFNLGKGAGLKLWQYFHFPQYAEFPLNTPRRVLLNLINRLLASRFDFGHISVSEAVKRDIRQGLINLNNHEVIYNALQPPKNVQDAETLERFLYKDKTFTIVIPGRLEKIKGQLWFLEVFRNFLLKNKLSYPEIRLALVGGGSMHQEIDRKIAQLNLGDAVFVTGSVSNAVVNTHICNADLVVVPSLLEGFGLVLLEALMYGKTVLCSDAGGLKEIIEHERTGFVFRAADSKDCLEKLTHLYYRKGEGVNKAKIEELLHNKFSFEKHMQNLIAVIENT